MAPGLQIPRGEADHDGDKSPKCQGPRAPRESFTPTAVSGRSAASSASGGGWGRAVAAALRPRGQVRAAGTRPETLSPGTRIDAPRRVEREGPGRSRRVEAEGTVRGRGDQPEASAGLGEGVTEDAPPTHVADWCPGEGPLHPNYSAVLGACGRAWAGERASQLIRPFSLSEPHRLQGLHLVPACPNWHQDSPVPKPLDLLTLNGFNSHLSFSLAPT